MTRQDKKGSFQPYEVVGLLLQGLFSLCVSLFADPFVLSLSYPMSRFHLLLSSGSEKAKRPGEEEIIGINLASRLIEHEKRKGT